MPVRSSRTIIPLSQSSTLIFFRSLVAAKERCDVDAQIFENLSNQIEDTSKRLVKAQNNGIEGRIDVFKKRTNDRNLGKKSLNRGKEGIQVSNDSYQKI